MFTPPIIQEDNYSCGDMVRGTASFIAAGEEIVAEIKYTPWRRIFARVLESDKFEGKYIPLPTCYPDLIKMLEDFALMVA